MGFYFANTHRKMYSVNNSITEMHIGDITYIIEHSQSDTAQESVENKLIRIIFREVERNSKLTDENNQRN